ncbi:hypothetical protein [Bradyrhizobium sp. G127]|uniref:hypothetical protein n=1 Tax=Bradyrhizobium sp. G127 TaxID=2904800 RepID=UPI001F306728|nr:hypothetical protein [Bradyrhizobium sp. G127]MCF2524449.1 hypothetical protein [Bradyrhizobium sp. G127]
MTLGSRKVSLVDCTLRDGSYQVGFGFTAAHTGALVSRLEKTGIEWIEVGHGLGLGAPASGRVRSAASDKDYIVAARDARKSAKIGVFAMQAFANTDDISRAVDLGIDFIRVGVDAGRFDEGENFIRHAARLNVHVTTFLMKTYTLGLTRLSENARRFADWGSDAVSIVDSAGGMTPPMVRDYVAVVKDRTNLPVNFHGHNNLQLAVGNAIAAIDAGATSLDASLRGLGRSAGNAQIEALAIALDRCGFDTACDALSLARLARDFYPAIIGAEASAPLFRSEDLVVGIDFPDLIQGKSFVHSALQPMIDEISEAANVDPADLAIEVGKISGGLDLGREAVKSVAEKLAGQGQSGD